MAKTSPAVWPQLHWLASSDKYANVRVKRYGRAFERRIVHAIGKLIGPGGNHDVLGVHSSTAWKRDKRRVVVVAAAAAAAAVMVVVCGGGGGGGGGVVCVCGGGGGGGNTKCAFLSSTSCPSTNVQDG
jgi:hypothetical protein